MDGLAGWEAEISDRLLGRGFGIASNTAGGGGVWGAGTRLHFAHFLQGDGEVEGGTSLLEADSEDCFLGAVWADDSDGEEAGGV